jgi:hypothetical protein
MKGEKNKMVGIIKNQIVFTPFAQVVKHLESIDPDLEKMLEVLSF